LQIGGIIGNARTEDHPWRNASGVRGLLAYCADYRCSHLKKMTPTEVNSWPDNVRLSDLEPRFMCQRCGNRGANMRPDFPPARMGAAARSFVAVTD